MAASVRRQISTRSTRSARWPTSFVHRAGRCSSQLRNSGGARAQVYDARPNLPPASPPPPAIIAVPVPVAPVVFVEVPVEFALVLLHLTAAVS